MQHNSSRQTLDELTNELVQRVGGQDPEQLMSLSRDLLAAAEVLTAQPGLRRVLSDSTTEAQGRRGLVDRLFSGQVGADALQTLQAVAAASWSSGSDLREGVVTLARTAAFVAAERSGELDRVEDELFRFGRTVLGNAELAQVLDDPTTAGSGRAGLVRRLLEGKASPITIELLADLAGQAQSRSFSHGIDALTAQAASRKGSLVAEVISAVELDAAQQQRLGAALQRIYGQPVALHIRVDPELQGGMRVTVGDEVIDGSVAGRLGAIRRRLAG